MDDDHHPSPRDRPRERHAPGGVGQDGGSRDPGEVDPAVAGRPGAAAGGGSNSRSTTIGRPSGATQAGRGPGET